MWSLARRESESSSKKLDERGLAGALGANDKDAMLLLARIRAVWLHNILERCGVLPPAHATRAVDSADLAAGVAVATTVGHALGPGVRIIIHVGGGRRADSGRRGGRRHSGARLVRHPVGIG